MNTPADASAFLNAIQPLLDAQGVSHAGIAKLDKPLSFAYYRAWIDAGYHGAMGYLADHAPLKETPQKLVPRAQSALMLAMPYLPHPDPKPRWPLKRARVSLYAQGGDYHFWFRKRLQNIADALSAQFPAQEFLAFTDAMPVLERDLARKAGLGWVGKNTCIIHPQQGSLFLLGEIYCSLPYENSAEDTPDHCGSCTACLDACPTQAFVAPRVLDARKCISYLTIESREIPPLELRAGIQDWLFGCDICQTVCPHNQKRFRGKLDSGTQQTLLENQQSELEDDLRYLLSSSAKRLDKDFKGTPLARAGGFGLKRNALIVVANTGAQALRDEVEALCTHARLGELARWALAKLDASRRSQPVT